MVYSFPIELRYNAGSDLCVEGNAYASKGEYDRAIEDLTNALRLSPDDKDIKEELQKVRRAKAGR